MNKLITNFDGSGRAPRHKQVAALTYIQDTWAERIVTVTLPTGDGKTAIGVALIKHYGGVYIVPTNLLVDQLHEEYPNINYLKGKEHYETPEQYNKAVERMLQGDPTFTNAFAYKNARYRDIKFVPKIVVYDEGHTLLDTFSLMGSTNISKKKYGSPEDNTTHGVVTWLGEIVAAKSLERSDESLTNDEKNALTYEIRSLSEIKTCITKEPHIYTTEESKTHIEVKPMRPPKDMIDDFFHGIKSVIMSATISTFKLKEILQERVFEHKVFVSDVPKEDRKVLYEPAPFAMNYKTNPKLIASWIKSKMKKYPDRNTICHLTYSDVVKLQEFFPEALCVNKYNKTEVIKEFKEKGGLLLAASCHTGIDLPGDECRLNLTPRLLKPNLHDMVVKKRKALEDGESWYKHEVIDMLIQQSGRSNRGLGDKSLHVVGDRNLRMFMSGIREEINMDFRNAIVWGRKR